MGRKSLFRDVLGLHLARSHLGRKTLGRPDDLRPSTVVDGDVDGQTGLGSRVGLQLVHQLLQLGVQRSAVAHEADADVPVLVVEALDEVLAEQPHDSTHFFGGTLPVFGRECVEIHRLHTQLIAVVRNVLKDLCALFVAGGTGQAAALGPAAIAVHDDADGQPLRKILWMFHDLIPLFSVWQKVPRTFFQRTAPPCLLAVRIRRT